MIRTSYVRFKFYAMVALWIFIVWSCFHGSVGLSVEPDRNRVTLPKFELDIQPILTARGCNSGSCHGKSRGQNGFALSLLGFDANFDYEAIVKSSRGRRLSMASVDTSLLLLKATGSIPHGGGVRIEQRSQDYERLLEWIQSGVLRTDADDPMLDKLAILPEPHSMKANEERMLSVIASYSDGTTRDVTSTCAYQSNEPAVVAVSVLGALKAGQLPGEATIMARFMGKIATWNTLVPREQKVPPQVYEALPRGNWIDDLVYQKLSTLNVVPSQPCSDHQYMRRVYLDAIGRLPTPSEVRSFLDDSATDKRTKLVDRVLALPDYADFWANKWADLLRPNPYRVGIKATLSLDGWLREAFRQNLPYDEFVKQLITAQGSTWQNGAVTIFRDRREPAEITTMISQLFLGVRLECAKCHQHPFEVYGQHDFFSLAAYFGRVGYKGTGLSPPISGGEESVLVKSKGDVRHPLTNEVLPPKTLLGDVSTIEPDQDPREKLVEWLLGSDNPYFSQVAANRIWAEMMGTGIVDPVDDFRATNPSSNPALLTALADYFRKVHFDNKQLMKAIFGSYIYALSSKPNETNLADHRNFSRHYRKRMRAEVLSDAISDAMEQPEEFDGMPIGTRATQLWTHRLDSELLDAFGRPDPNQDPPCERTPDATMGQTLHLMNAPRIQARLSMDGSRCDRLAKSNLEPKALIEELYLATFSRYPSTEENSALEAEFAKSDTDRRRLLEDLLWSLINSPEFLYID